MYTDGRISTGADTVEVADHVGRVGMFGRSSDHCIHAIRPECVLSTKGGCITDVEHILYYRRSKNKPIRRSRSSISPREIISHYWQCTTRGRSITLVNHGASRTTCK